jgi:hypothetical protein
VIPKLRSDPAIPLRASNYAAQDIGGSREGAPTRRSRIEEFRTAVWHLRRIPARRPAPMFDRFLLPLLAVVALALVALA